MSEAPSARGIEGLCRGVIALAALLVPAPRRPAWREEWTAEVWHHFDQRGGAGLGFADVRILLRCFGAFPHALWVLREEWTMDGIRQDLRFATRALIRRPLFAAMTIATLAIGIGGTTAVFSVVNTVLLRPLPLANADRLVWLWGREFNGSPTASVSPPDFHDYAQGAAGFEALAAYTSFSDISVYADGDRPTELTSRGATHNFLDVIGEKPAYGRAFTEEETRAMESDVVMISHGLWGRLFGFDRDVLGRSMGLDGVAHTIVGVLPEGLSLPANFDLLTPLTFGAEGYDRRAFHFLRPIGLLAEGASVADAQAGLDAVSARLEAAYPDTNDGWYAIAQPLRSVFVGSVRPALLMLFAATGFVLLIACGNVANLLLVRAVGRQGEVSVRSALGASRGRLLRQLMTESLLMALVAGALGVLVAKLGVLGLMKVQPGNIPRLEDVALDGTVLTFSIAVSVVVGLLFGLAPALGLVSRDTTEGLRAAGRDRVGGRGRLRDVLIGGEVALSFVLVTGAILLSRSFSELRSVDPGFESEGVVGLSLNFPSDAFESLDQAVVALDRIKDQVAALPGVVAVGAATVIPFSGSGGDTYVYAEDRPPLQIENIQNTAFIRYVDEGYVDVLGMPMVAGRAFQRTDDQGTTLRVVINEALATSLYPDEDPVGKRLVVSLDSLSALEIIGVVRDAQQFSMGTPAGAEFLLSARQFPRRGLRVIARGVGGVPPPLTALREAIWEADPSQPLTRALDLEQLVRASLAPGRFQALLLGLFSALAVGLAGLGVYGVLAAGVSEGKREIGVRMAMGAQPSSVVREVVTRGLKLAVVGSAIGCVVALGVTRLLSTLLFGVGPRDLTAFLLTPVFLGIVVVLASWIPARQAARVDPSSALRVDG